MSAGGLSRRRVGAGGGTTADDADGPSNTSNAQSSIPRVSTPTVQSSLNGQGSYGGTALEGGNKVAYDPRDLVEQEQDGGKMPLLSLLDEVLLLGLKDKQVRLQFARLQAPL